MCGAILGRGKCYVHKWGKRVVNYGDEVVGDEQV